MSLRRWLVTGLGCVAVTAGLATFKVLEIQGFIAMAEAYPEHSETVGGAVTKAAKHQAYSEVLGEVVAPQRLEVRNELPGKIISIGYASGENVANGQLLIALDTRIEKAQLTAAEARFTYAKSTWERSQSLKDDKNISQQGYDEARANYLAAQAEIEGLKTTIEKKEIRAPFVARTSIHNLEVGQFLQPNMIVTTLIGITDYLWLDFSLPQKIPPLDIGTIITATVNQREYQATVIAKESEVSTTSRQLGYRARVNNTDGLLQVNSVVRVRVPSGPEIEAIETVDTAVGHDRFGAYVYELKPDGDAYRANRIGINLLSKQDGRAIITGVDAGTFIAEVGTFKLYPGLKVYVSPQVFSVDDNAKTSASAEGY
ncbi:efflux RND transporter periplasmic adaptor subunit [Thalassolituus sp.]|jgi:membrane fusion protein (multidrug efflux system)|uniref:efflux RND transporter periplasmic adaptor subunit n=1 Tax=Thalassolituus sp. TaxID=2030822 RepID=UPI002A84024F|nr:efflux RND transporter periplasmic adaptor subunit [Thalassolituus sp.]